MDRLGIERAAKLLAKAASTDSDEEAAAFVEHTYRLLAQIITAHEAARGETAFGSGGRERRLLVDRRSGQVVPLIVSERAAYAGALYSEVATMTRRPEGERVNLHL